MQCPNCHANLSFHQVTRYVCPICGVKIHFSPRWRYLRGISCAFVAVLVNYRWYPLEGSFAAHLVWFAVLLAFFLFLSYISFRLFPPPLDLVPGNGPIRLDL